MPFPAAFREHVGPALVRLCRVHGTFLALGEEGWLEAFNGVWDHARQRGALMLPDRGPMGWEALREWIATRLLAECDKAEEILAESHGAPHLMQGIGTGRPDA